MRTLLLGTAIACGVPMVLAGPAWSQSANAQIQSFAIPAQPLRSAVVAFSRAAGISVTSDGAFPGELRAAAVSGDMTIGQGLERLLRGTGYSYRFTGPRSVVLLAPVAALAPIAMADGNAVLLEDVTLSGAANGQFSAAAAHQAPAAVAFISNERIQTFRGTSVGDFVRGTPGVLNGENRNSGGLDLNVRGMQGQGRVPVVVDGSLQENTVWRGYSGVAGRSYLDPDLVGGMVIEKGPSTAPDAVGATGGIARVRTLQAEDIIQPGADRGFVLKIGVIGNNAKPPPAIIPGGFQPYARYFNRPGLLEFNGGSASIAYAQRFGNFELVGALVKRQQGNYFSGTNGPLPGIAGVTNRYGYDEQILNTAHDNVSALLRGTWRFGDGHKLDLSYMRYDSEFSEIMPSQLIWGAGALQAESSDAEVDTWTLRYNWNPVDNDLIDLKADLWSTSTYSAIRTPTRIEFGTVRINNDSLYASQSDRWGINLSNTARLTTGMGPLVLNFGASYDHERLAPPKDFAAMLAASGYRFASASRDGARRQSSAFVSADWQPTDRLQLTGALRYTHAFTRDNTPGVGPAAGRFKEQSAGGWSPILAAKYELRPGVEVFGRYATGLRPPSLFETTGGWSANADPDHFLRPERARNIEIGASYAGQSVLREGDQLRAKLSFFDNKVEDYITRISHSTYGTVNANMKSAQFRGFEVSASYDAGVWFIEGAAAKYNRMRICAPTDITSVSFTGQPACVDNGGYVNSYSMHHQPPKFSGTLTAGVRLLEDRLTLGARLTHVGQRMQSGASTFVVVDWSPYNVVDLFGSYKLNDRVQFDFGVDNVADRYYMDSLTLGQMPSPGRTLRASLTARF